jgi:hypothetical protein
MYALRVFEIVFAKQFDYMPEDVRARMDLRLRNIAFSLGNIQNDQGTIQDSVVVLVIDAWRIQYRVEASAGRLLVEEALFLGRE